MEDEDEAGGGRTLPEDCFGKVLPLLDDNDKQSLLLASKDWHNAGVRQMRTLRPLYLPATPPLGANYSSLEELQLALIRQQCEGLTTVCPLRHFSSIAALGHAAEVDLAGQSLPPDCCALLGHCFSRLRTLSLRTCRLPLQALLHIGTLNSLHALDLAGLQLTPPDAAAAAAAATGRGALGASAEQPGAAPAASSAAAGEPSAAAELEVLLDQVLAAVLQLPLLERLNLDIHSARPDLPSAGGGPPASFHQDGLVLHGRLSRLLGTQHSALAACRSLQSLSCLGNRLTAADWLALCSSMPQLTELQLPWVTADPALQLHAAAFSAISSLRRLEALTLDMALRLQDQHEPYSLAPLAGSLQRLSVRVRGGLPLLLSLTECSRVTQLELAGSGWAMREELLVQVVRSMPLLQHLTVRQLAPTLSSRLREAGDYLISQLDCCASHLTTLVLSKVPMNGTGIKLAATSHCGTDSAAAGVPGIGGGGCLQRLQHLELCATELWHATLPHFSYLSSLRSLVLHGVLQRQFPQACKLGVFKGLAGLSMLTSLRVLPLPDERPLHEQQQQQQQQQPGAVEPAEAAQHLQQLQQELQHLQEQVEVLQPQVQEHQAQHLLALLAEAQQQVAEAEQHIGPVNAAGLPALMLQHLVQLDQPFEQQQQQQAGGVMPPAAAAVDAGGEADDEIWDEDWGEEEEEDDGEEGVWALLAGANDVVMPGGGGGGPQAAAAAPQQPQQQEHPLIVLPQINGGGGGGPWGPAAAVAARPREVEPHLHFLAGMTQLVELELGCIASKGLCLLHLQALQQLRRLTLQGCITFSHGSLQPLAQLQLPGVTSLRMAGCCMVQGHSSSSSGDGGSSSGGGSSSAAGSPAAAAAAAAANDEGSAAAAGLGPLLTVLCSCFPGLVSLEFGSCRQLDLRGFGLLLQRLPQLRRLVLLGLDLGLDRQGSNSSLSGQHSVVRDILMVLAHGLGGSQDMLMAGSAAAGCNEGLAVVAGAGDGRGSGAAAARVSSCGGAAAPRLPGQLFAVPQRLKHFELREGCELPLTAAAAVVTASSGAGDAGWQGGRRRRLAFVRHGDRMLLC